MNNLQHHKLLNKYLQGRTTPEENAVLETWYMRYEDDSLSTVDSEARIGQLAHIRAALVAKSSTLVSGDHLPDADHQPLLTKTASRSVRLWPLRKIAVAAAVLIIGASAGLFYISRQESHKYRPEFTKDISPGKNAAVLTLANGNKIYIDDAAAGNIAEQSGVSISKTAHGQIVYHIKPGAKGALEYNTLQTSNGQQTQVILPDQSKVYLNASSSIKYPSSFASLKQRKVELTGEAYFEVAKDREHPFIVKTVLQEVQVLGTHFNINSYADEPKLKTTLLEGSVQVCYGAYTVMLKPGQQSALRAQPAEGRPAVIVAGSKVDARSNKTGIKISETDLKVTQADIAEVMAWKSGYFRFEEEPLESVMRKIARWYNVDVAYAPDVPKDILLGGFISRSKNVSAVLEMMTRTEDVKFKIEGRKVIVQKYK